MNKSIKMDLDSNVKILDLHTSDFLPVWAWLAINWPGY